MGIKISLFENHGSPRIMTLNKLISQANKKLKDRHDVDYIEFMDTTKSKEEYPGELVLVLILVLEDGTKEEMRVT